MPEEFLQTKEDEKCLRMLQIKEEYLKQEIGVLRNELGRAKEEINRVRSVPLLMGQFLEAIDRNTAIVSSSACTNAVVKILSTVDRELLLPNTSVALHRHSSAIVDVLPPEADTTIPVVGEEERPDVTYDDIGGMDVQKQEIRECVELPLVLFARYRAIGIEPPRGVLLYGPPGTGKTMLVKAVANQAKATFIKVNGSEFIQKYLGEGPRMVRDVFRLAREKAPSIIFIDEIDSIATKRFDASTSADREVQRVLIELLNQMDGFDQSSNVKVIMATNRPDSIDPALLRPGRLDRKIEFPLPDKRQKRLVLATITNKMALHEEVALEEFVGRPDRLSCADLNAICQEAGMLAVRASRYEIMQCDFEEAYSRVVDRKDSKLPLYH
ncbi:PRS6B [Enterospora canceri]|uniref:26S proteasome regulatory subunit 6B homolog n=1 Tax=Enterospora canceri TaxID=1081671 RepID=A0A1Y1S7W7_9MICR|nr:PRS6B [Enterospora canceri]